MRALRAHTHLIDEIPTDASEVRARTPASSLVWILSIQ